MGVPPINATPNPDSNSIRGATPKKLESITHVFKTVFLNNPPTESSSSDIALTLLSVAADPASIPISVDQLSQAVRKLEAENRGEVILPPPENEIDLSANTVFAMLRLLYAPDAVLRFWKESGQVTRQMLNSLYGGLERAQAGVSLASLFRRMVGASNMIIFNADFFSQMRGQFHTTFHTISTGPLRPITNVVEGALGLISTGIRIYKGRELEYKVPTLKGRSIENLTQTLKDLKKQWNVTYQEMFTEYTNKAKFKNSASGELDFTKINDALEKETDKRVLAPAKAFIKELQKNHSFEELKSLFPAGVEAWKDFFEGKDADKKLSASLSSFLNQFTETMDAPEKAEQKKLLCESLKVDLEPATLEHLKFKSILALHMLREEKLKIKQEKLGDVVGSKMAAKLKQADTISLIAQMALPPDTITATKAKEVVAEMINDVQKEMWTKLKKDLFSLVTFSFVLTGAAIWLASWANPALLGGMLVAGAVFGLVSSILFTAMDTHALYEKLSESMLEKRDKWILGLSWAVVVTFTIVFLAVLVPSGIPPQVISGLFGSAIGGAGIWLAANVWIFRKWWEEKFQRGVANVQQFWQTKMGTIAVPSGYQPLLEGELEVREDDGKTQKILENMCLRDLNQALEIASKIRSPQLYSLLQYYSSSNEEFLRTYGNDPLFIQKVAIASQKQRASKGDRRLQNITDIAKAFATLGSRKQASLRKKFIKEKTQEILDASPAKRSELRSALTQALVEENRKQNKQLIKDLGIIPQLGIVHRPATP